MSEEPQHNDRMDSAKDHIAKALDDIKAYCSDDLPKQTKEFSEEFGDKVLSGIDDAADSLIELLINVKKKVKNAKETDKSNS